MDYVVGNVAALISGNVTPNRPKRLKKPLTPMKHQTSPNVTPKSQLVDDKSIFLSPTLQKKKAIVKKSPKRIFQNDLDVTNEEGESSFSSPKADKVKKHLKNELNTESFPSAVLLSPKSPINEPKAEDELEKNSKENKNKKKKKLSSNLLEAEVLQDESVNNIDNDKENTEQMVSNQQSKQKKNRKRSKSVADREDTDEFENIKNKTAEIMTNASLHNVDEGKDISKNKSPKKKRKQSKSMEEENLENITEINAAIKAVEQDVQNEEDLADVSQNKSPRKKKKQSKAVAGKDATTTSEITTETIETEKDAIINEKDISQSESPKKKRKKSKSVAQQEKSENEANDVLQDGVSSKNVDDDGLKKGSKKKDKKQKKKSQNKSKNAIEVNPNAVTNKDSDSEHESDDEMLSENEEENKKTLDTGPAEGSSDEEDASTNTETKTKAKTEKKEQPQTVDDIKRTIFVGNVPFSNKCKKEIKKIFNQYGQIETVRIRTVPVKDARVTPKLAVIKNELHPDRSTVNVYIKFAGESSVNKALAENNSMLNGCHLRVSRSDSTGAAHDPKCSVFVGNIPFTLEDEGLREKFHKCGPIESVRIIRDKKTNAGKGFGYINFKSKDGVELALALTEEDLTIKNRILRVKRCTQLTHKQTIRQDARKRGDVNGQGNQGRQGHSRAWNKGNDQSDKGKFRPDNPDGAYRRIKRKNQDGAEAQPKKNRKEFVGLTAEKKKKQKFNKGQKKKKVLSEILTKK